MATVVESLVTELRADDAGFAQKMAANAKAVDGLAASLAKVQSARGTDLGGLSAIEKRISLLSQASQIESTRSTALQQLIRVEGVLTRTLTNTNLSLQQRVAVEQQLARTQSLLAGPAGNYATAVGKTATTQVAAAASARTFGEALNGVRGRLTNVAGDLAATGRVTGELRGRLIDVASDIAAALGPGGLMVGAIGLGTFAIIQYFRKAKEEAEKAAKEFDTTINDLLNKGDFAGLQSQARSVFEGTAAEDFRDGLRSLREQFAEAEDIKRNNPLATLDAEFTKSLRSLKTKLDEAEQRFAKLQVQIQRTGPAIARAVNTITITASAPSKPSDDRERQKAIDDANRQLDALTKKAQESSRAIADAISSADTDLAKLAGDSVAVLDAQISELTKKFKELGASDADVARIIAPLVAARDAANALNGAAARIEIPDDVAKELNTFATETGKGATQTRTWADNLSDVLDTALGVATALGGANSQLTRALAGAAQLASSFAKIADLAKEAGGLGKLFSSGGGILSALPALGGIIGGVGALTSLLNKGESAAERSQRELLERNNQRLKELRDTLAQSVAQSLSGPDRRTLEALAGVPFTAPGPPEIDPVTGETIVRDVARSAADILADLAKVGVGMDDLRKAAKAVGVELSDNPTADELYQLGVALSTLDFDTFLNTFAGQLDRLNDEFELFPERFKTNADRFRATVELLNDPDLGAPALFAALDGIDTSTVEGAKAAREEIQRLFAALASGDLTAEDLGGLSLKEFRDALKALNATLGDVIGPVTSAFETISQALADLQDELELLDITDATERARRIVELVSGLVPAIASALGDVDLTTAEGASAADAILKDLFANRETLSTIERGGLSIEEFTQLLLQLDNALDASVGSLKDRIAEELEAAKQAEEARLQGLDDAQRAAEQARAKKIREAIERASNESTFEGDTAIERIQRLVAALGELSPALGGLLEGLDLSTAEGLFEFNARLQELFESLGDGADAADLGELSLSELLEILLDLRNGSDSLADALADVVTAAETAADRLRAAFSDLDFSLELEGISDPLERLKRTAQAAASALPEVAQALAGLDLSTLGGRAAAEARLVALGKSTTDQTVRDAVLRLLGSIRGIAADQASLAASAGTPAATPDASVTLQGTPQITAIQADRLLDLQRSQLTVLRDIRGLLMPRAPTLPPAIPTAFSGGSGGGSLVLRMQNTFNFGALAGDERTLAQRLSDTLLREIDEGLQRLRDRALLANGVTTR